VRLVTVFKNRPVFFVCCVSMRSIHAVPLIHGYSTEIFELKSSASNEK
jgi:hypothetical protein